MGKSNAAANVIDLEAFRQRKMREEREPEEPSVDAGVPAQMFVPVWICWVPVWAPVMP